MVSNITGIIFKTTDRITGRWFIGMDLNNDPSFFGNQPDLLASIKQHGCENFTKEILLYSNHVVELELAERHYIKISNALSDPSSYNYSGATDNIIINDKVKEIYITRPAEKKTLRSIKISRALSGKEKSPEHRKNISRSKTGKKQSQSTIDKKKKTSKELYDAGIIAPPTGHWKGKTHSDLSKEKISQSKTGVKNYKKRLFNQEDANKMLELKNAGYKTGDIAEMFSTTGPTVLRYIKEILS